MNTDKTCVVCGKPFHPKKKSQMCCSAKCANVKAHNSMKKTNTCQHCGKAFWRPNAYRMKYCSLDCQTAARAKIHPKKEKTLPVIYRRICAWCGEEFETTNPNKIYCSSQCGYQGSLKLKRDQWAAAYVSRTYICKECGSEFTTECGNTHSVFCCQSCADKYERKHEHSTERHKIYMRDMNKKREQQINAAFVEDVPYDYIYERDMGICQICSLPVHPFKNIDSYWDGTIDHIVPLSSGGKHSKKNCQLAHRICNSLKGKEAEAFSVDWMQKAAENNYWRIKYEQYQHLMES